MNRVLLISVTLVACLFGGLYFYYHDKGVIAKVTYSMSSCFASEESTLILYKKDNFVFAELMTKGKPKQIVCLNKVQIDSFQMFAVKLINLNNSRGCTTVSDYILNMDNKTIKRTDGSCANWDGFRNLKAFLFKKI